MPRRLEMVISQNGAATGRNQGACTYYLIQTPTGVLYYVYIDAAADISFKKSTDGGFTWSVGTVVYTGTAFNLSVWYDKWSGLSSGLIHCSFVETVGHDCLYRTIDTDSSDTLSTTSTVIFAGTSAVLAGSFMSITRSRGGNVYCRTQIDNGTEGGFFRLTNANVPNGVWDTRTINEAAATTDMMILMPGFATDNNDIIGIFWDISTNEVSRQLYDDSANTWAETLISASMADSPASVAFSNFSAVPDLTNSRIILTAWNGVDTLNADLQAWIITETAITALTNVVNNSVDDQGLCAITLDLVTNYWYVFYAGKSDGSETWPTSMNMYYKVSTDAGTTWGAETLMTNQLYNLTGIYTIPRLYIKPNPIILSIDANADEYRISVDITKPRARLQLGIT